MPSRSSRSRPASRTSLSEPTGSASRTAIRLPPRLERRLHCIDAHRMERVSTVFDSDVFEVEQLLRPMVNIYKISSRGLPVAFVRQKRMAVKEDIRFFADESEAQELFRIKARSLMEFGGRYDVITPAGEKIGVLGKVFGKSLLRSTWSVMDANERSQFWALARRLTDLIPYADFIPIVFHFRIDRGDQHLGDFTRTLGLRDRYTLDLSGDTDRTVDRKLAIALAIALDALQSR